MADSECPRSDGNTSELDTDLECEEEEVSGAHSDSEVTGRDQEEEVAGRKRMHSETTSTTDSLEHSRDERGKQASNLHNEREKERRKDLKQAVHRLRNQLQLHQTKKATTISVLKASELEIKDLVHKEESQNRELADLQTRHKHLTWKLESLMADQQRGVSRSLTTSGSSPAPILPPSLIPPPLSSVSPVFYVPPTPTAPSIPPSPHTPSLMVPPHRPISPSTFPFAASYAGFPHPSLLSPAAVFPSIPAHTAHPHHPHHCFPLHPAARPFLVMPTTSPHSFALPSFLPRFPVTPGHFFFPSAPGTHPHHQSSLLLHSISPPGQMAPPHFPLLLTGSPPVPSESRDPNTSSPQPSSTGSDDGAHRDSPEQALHGSSDSSQLILPATDSAGAEDIDWESTSQATQGEHDTTQRRGSVASSELIDVETPDHEEGDLVELGREKQSFLGLRCPHRKQRKRHERKNLKVHKKPLPLEKKTRERKNGRAKALQLVGIARKDSVSRDFESLDEAMSRDSVFVLKNQGLLFNESTQTSTDEKEGERFRVWKRRKQPSPSSVLDLTTTRLLPPVICS